MSVVQQAVEPDGDQLMQFVAQTPSDLGFEARA
jgi:hypothetical protein